MEVEAVEAGQGEQGIRRFLVIRGPHPPHLHSHSHVVIDHSLGGAADVVEVVAVGFHEGQRMFPEEEIGRAVVAVGQREHGHADR